MCEISQHREAATHGNLIWRPSSSEDDYQVVDGNGAQENDFDALMRERFDTISSLFDRPTQESEVPASHRKPSLAGISARGTAMSHTGSLMATPAPWRRQNESNSQAEDTDNDNHSDQEEEFHAAAELFDIMNGEFDDGMFDTLPVEQMLAKHGSSSQHQPSHDGSEFSPFENTLWVEKYMGSVADITDKLGMVEKRIAASQIDDNESDATYERAAQECDNFDEMDDERMTSKEDEPTYAAACLACLDHDTDHDLHHEVNDDDDDDDDCSPLGDDNVVRDDDLFDESDSSSRESPPPPSMGRSRKSESDMRRTKNMSRKLGNTTGSVNL